eukprot:12079068-Alexandrium_andersonii.AAC.1
MMSSIGSTAADDSDGKSWIAGGGSGNGCVSAGPVGGDGTEPQGRPEVGYAIAKSAGPDLLTQRSC